MLYIFPRTILITTNLHWIMLVLIVVGSITLYGKRKEGQEGQMIEQEFQGGVEDE